MIVRPIASPATTLNGPRVSTAAPNMTKHEEERQDRLEQEAGAGVDAVAERGHAEVDRFGRSARQQLLDEQRRQRGAAELRDPVDARERRLDLARDQEAERDRGVEVPAGDVPERADHHADREPVGDRDADQRGVVDDAGGRGRAGADEGERERADHLGDGATQGVFGHGGNVRIASDRFAGLRPPHGAEG